MIGKTVTIKSFFSPPETAVVLDTRPAVPCPFPYNTWDKGAMALIQRPDGRQSWVAQVWLEVTA